MTDSAVVSFVSWFININTYMCGLWGYYRPQIWSYSFHFHKSHSECDHSKNHSATDHTEGFMRVSCKGICVYMSWGCGGHLGIYKCVIKSLLSFLRFFLFMWKCRKIPPKHALTDQNYNWNQPDYNWNIQMINNNTNCIIVHKWVCPWSCLWLQ